LQETPGVTPSLRQTPPFGRADLSNCEREQIHLAGSIQPHGALLLVRETDHVIVQASANASAFLGTGARVIGSPLGEIEGDLAARIVPHLSDSLDQNPVAVRCRIGSPGCEFDGMLHRPPGAGLAIELEPAGPPVDLSRHVEGALQAILAASSMRALGDEAARLFKDLTGYDRVMVYRFDEDGHGEVFSERREAHLEPYLGNRYPASDIPQIARQLYRRNRVRVLVDVGCAAVPLEPRLSPLTGADLDMSLCFLRNMSPIHVQYLKNMGVAATLVASLVIGSRLWGLVACHHYVPRFAHFEVRAVCELLAEAVSTRIAALEGFAQAQAELSARRLEQRMIEAISREGDWRSGLFDGSQALLHSIDASGAALLFEGQVLTAGDVPGTRQLRDIGAWLDAHSGKSLLHTASFCVDHPEFAPLIPVASGLLATPVSTTPGEYLVWFRPERVRTVTWGGNPFKPVVIGDNPSQLSPRSSFAQWHQLVVGTAEPWTPADLVAARLIGESVADVVLQFRSVKMLIAQDQLAGVSRQVGLSDQPVVIADCAGRILQVNEAFERLLRAAHPHLRVVEDLPVLFSEPGELRQKLQDLIELRRPWRGEIGLETRMGEGKRLLVRADPVLVAPDRVLGFVLLFTDLTERKAADAARRRFQECIIEQDRGVALRLDSKADLVYRNLLASVVGNAKLAALEITDGADLAHVPEMLESVRASVNRAAGLLKRLIWHATGASDGKLWQIKSLRRQRKAGRREQP
jgi:chemotaxis family two-component system sensor kinase Cph1